MVGAIGNVGQKVKIADGLFWGACAVLGAQVQELEDGGVDWLAHQLINRK